MLINRWLRDKGYIFVQNANPLYIKLLIDLGSHPIFIYIRNNTKSIYIGYKWDNTAYIKGEHDLFYSQYLDSIFNFDICTISDIKYFLSELRTYRYNKLEHSISVGVPYKFSIMYFR